MPNVTVLGSNAKNIPPNNTTVWTVPGGFNQAQILKAATSLASQISSAVANGTDAAFTFTGTTPPALTDGQVGVLYVGDAANGTGDGDKGDSHHHHHGKDDDHKPSTPAQVSTVSLYYGYPGLIDTSSKPLTITGSAGANPWTPVSIIAGTGGINYTNTTVRTAPVGAGTIIAAGGDNAIYINGAVSTGGGYDILLDSGNNTIVAASGNDTINAGTGTNAVTLGAGRDILQSNGTDAVLGGSGAATIAVQTGTVSFSGGAGTLSFLSGSFEASTVVGGSGAVTAFGGFGGGYFKGGSNGDNYLVAQSGNTTLVGGGAGDTLQSAGADSLLAGPGAASIGGGVGLDTVDFGAGSDTFSSASHGAASLSGGEDVFAFNAASTGGAHDLIANFTSGLDTISLIGYSGTPTVSLLNTVSGATVSAQTTDPSTIHGGFYNNPHVVTVVKLSDNTTITLTGMTGFTHNISSSGLS